MMNEQKKIPQKIPECIGFIMDGNRRWATSRGLSKLEGHPAGVETVKNVVKWAKEAGVKHVIFYTFSTENWNRTQEEISYLFSLITKFMESELDNFHKEGGVLHYVGDLTRFPVDLQNVLKKSQEKTKDNKEGHVYFALNYGGRAEILSAVKRVVKENSLKNIQEEEITEEYFASHLQTYPMPDPDIIIRTSGEQRLSGFLPWQSVYSELFFTKTLWPDFSKEEFLSILDEYNERERRMGK